MKIAMASLTLCGMLFGQAPQAANPTQQAVTEQPGGSTPVYRVTVVARTTKAINYHHRSGATHIDFRGTALSAFISAETSRWPGRTGFLRPTQALHRARCGE